MSAISHKRKIDAGELLPYTVQADQLEQNKRIKLLAEEIFDSSSDTQMSSSEPHPLTISDPAAGTISDHDFNAMLDESDIKADLFSWVEGGDGDFAYAMGLIQSWREKNTTLTIYLGERNSSPLQPSICKSLPSCLSYFTHLEKLEIHASDSEHHLIRSIPFNFRNLQKLKELTLNCPCLNKLPRSIVHLKGLEKLSISAGSQLAQLPDGFENLRHLKKINFQNCDIRFLEIFTKLPELASLTLDNCGVEELPEGLERMSLLTHLNLSMNGFDCTGLGKLSNLNELILIDIFAIDNDFSYELSQLEKLNRLELSTIQNYDIIEIPETIGNLINLKRLLWVADCNSIPAGISLLTKLQYLDLSSNYIEEIPASIASLTNLSFLDLSNNAIRELPLSLTGLSSQCTIDATENSLSANSLLTFQSEIQRVRSENPLLGPRLLASIDEEDEDAPLPEDLQALLNKVSSQLTEDQTKSLEGFLKKTQYTADYTAASYKQPLLIRLEKMLTEGLSNQTFRDNLFPIINEATTTCSDRATIYLNLIEVQWILHCSGKNHTDQDLANIIIGLHRMELLEKIAEKSGVELLLGDPIEVSLYYQIKLKEALNLPFSTMDLSHGEIVERQLTPERLNAAKESILAATSTLEQKVFILAQSDLWKERIKAETEATLAEISSNFGKRGETLENSGLEGQKLIDAWKALSDERNAQELNVLSSITKRRLEAVLR